jgi:hypothetical protein
MLESLLVNRLEAALPAVLLFYLADYFLTVYEARLYLGGAQRSVNFQGQYSSSTIFHFDKPAPRWWNPQYLWILLILAASVSATWYLLVTRYRLPEVFAFLVGGLLLIEAAVIFRQVRRIILFHYIQNGRGVRGEVEISRRLNLVLWFNELYCFAALYLFCFLLTGSWFFLGGAFTCLVTSRRQRDYAVMLPEPLAPQPAGQKPTNGANQE